VSSRAIHASSGVAGGYAFRAGQALPPLRLDDEEALPVAIALQIAAAGTVSGVEESSLRALVKLAQVMPARLRRRTDALRSAILPLQRMGPTVDANVLATLAAACRDQLQVGFAYRDVRSRSSTRTVGAAGPCARRQPLVPRGLGPGARRLVHLPHRPRAGCARQRRTLRAPPAPGGGDLGAFVSGTLAVAI